MKAAIRYIERIRSNFDRYVGRNDQSLVRQFRRSKPDQIAPADFMRLSAKARRGFLAECAHHGNTGLIEHLSDAVIAGGGFDEVLQVAGAITSPVQARRSLEQLKRRIPSPDESLSVFYGAATILARKCESWPDLLAFARRALAHQPSRLVIFRDIALALRKMRYVPQIDRLAAHFGWRQRTGKLALADYITVLRAMQYRRPLVDMLEAVESSGDAVARVAYVDALAELCHLDRASELAVLWDVDPSELSAESAAALQHFRYRQSGTGATSFDQAIDAVLGHLDGRLDAPAAAAGRPQRILIFASSLGVGGGERQLVHLLEYLSRVPGRYDVALLVTFRARELKLSSALSGIRIVYRDELAPSSADAPHCLSDDELSDIEIILRRPRFEPVARFARDFRPDIVYHAVGLPMDALLVGLLTGAATIVRFGGLDFKTNYDATDIQAINARIAERCCARLAQAVTFVTNSMAAREVWAERLAVGLDRFKVIYNGVEFAPLLSAEARQARKAALFGDPSIIVVGFVGRFQNVKRVDLWISVALELAPRDPRVRFLLLGDGPLAPRMKAKVAATEFCDRFHFSGAVLGGLSDLYQAMDILMHTSSTESLPNVVIEAIGHGTFAVAAPVGDVPHIIGTPYRGELVPTNDFSGYVSALSNALSHIDTLERDRERRAADIRQSFGMRRMWAEIARTLRRAGRRRGGRAGSGVGQHFVV